MNHEIDRKLKFHRNPIGSHDQVSQMLSFFRFGVCIVCFASLTGCLIDSGHLPSVPMTPEQIQQSVNCFEESRSVQERVASVSSPILIANADLCGQRTAHSIGLEWVTINDFPANIRKDIGPTLKVGEISSILYVEARSPAAKAGLRRGDVLLTINNVSIKEDRLQTRRESQKNE